MPLDKDIEKAFQDTYDLSLDSNGEEGTIEDVAAGIVDAYKTSVSSAKDMNNNIWTVPSFDLLEKAIIGAFTLCKETKAPTLIFTPIEASLLATWAPATMKTLLPFAPAMPITVFSGIVTLPGIPIPTPPLPKADENTTLQPIVDAFTNMFKNHAKTIIFSYSGLGPPAPPALPLGPPVPALPVPGGVTLK